MTFTLIDPFTTTSVLELQASIDTTKVSTGVYLQNNMNTVAYVLKYIHTVYNGFVQREVWDKCVRSISEPAVLIASSLEMTLLAQLVH